MRRAAFIAAAAAVVLGVGVALFLSRRAVPVSSPARGAVSPDAVAATPPDNAAPAPGVPVRRERPDVEIAPPPSVAAIPVHADFTAPSELRNAPVFPAPSISVIGGRDIMDPDELAQLLDEFGGWAGLYRIATADERGDLIVALDLADGGVRSQLRALLPQEADSDLRAMMISRTDPEGFFDEGTDELPVDQELVDLLRAESATSVERDEWIARMQVAALAQEEFGVEMTRRALADHPDDPQVRLWASVLQLGLNRMVEGVEPQEVAAAEGFLFARLGGESGGAFSVEQRIQGYSALAFSSDPRVAREFLSARIGSEPDPRARATLQNLVSLLERVAG